MAHTPNRAQSKYEKRQLSLLFVYTSLKKCRVIYSLSFKNFYCSKDINDSLISTKISRLKNSLLP